MERLFGTDGVRGLANRYPMSPAMVLRLGQAIGQYFKSRYPNPKIMIGKDTRRSGYMLEQALSAGICSVGVDTFFLGPLPTAGIAYLTRGMRACAGIVISASHNPYEDNGIKIFNSDGFKLPDAEEDRLEAMLALDLESQLPTGEGIGRSRRVEDAIGQYAVYLKEQFPKHLSMEGMRVVIDCANGAGYKVAPKVFSELGAEIFVIGQEPSGYNINEDCGALYPNRLRERVLLYKADIGIALDGDADRVVIVDNKGEILDGDELLAMCGLFMHESGKLKGNTVVATVMSNLGLEIALQKAGIKLSRTNVGDRYVMEEMLRGDFRLGGEQSGHLIFRDSATTGDGVLAALHVIEIMLTKQKTIHELKKVMQKVPQVVRSVRVQDKVPLERLPELSNLITACEKRLNGGGRVLFRYSGTESKARVMIEGESESMIEEMADQISSLAVAEILRQVQVSSHS